MSRSPININISKSHSPSKQHSLMAHPGRPRRRKVPSVSNTTNTHSSVSAIPEFHKPKVPKKEEPTNNVHDEGDIISYRADGLNRIIMNQELLENVTSKYFHSSKIIPPSSFPTYLQKQTAGMTPEEKTTFYHQLKPSDIYFGDNDFMKLKSEKLQEEVSELKKPAEVDFGEEYRFQAQKMEELSKLSNNVYDSQSLDKLEQEYNKCLQEYQEKFNKKMSLVQKYNQFSVPTSKFLVKVELAPPGYNPKLIDSLINRIGQEDKGEGNGEGEGEKEGNGDGDGDQKPENVGPFLDNHDDMPFLEFNNDEHEGPIIQDDMNEFFDPEQEREGIVDDMNELINFQGDEEMQGEEFEENFLSHIV